MSVIEMEKGSELMERPFAKVFGAVPVIDGCDLGENMAFIEHHGKFSPWVLQQIRKRLKFLGQHVFRISRSFDFYRMRDLWRVDFYAKDRFNGRTMYHHAGGYKLHLALRSAERHIREYGGIPEEGESFEVYMPGLFTEDE